MAEFFAFLVNHWILSSAFVLVAFMLIANEMKGSLSAVKALSPEQVVNIINHDNAVVVDLRSKENFREGHVMGSINVPRNELEQKLKLINKYKNAVVVLVCDMGIDSPKAGLILKQNGFSQLTHLQGGLAAWRKENLPIQKN